MLTKIKATQNDYQTVLSIWEKSAQKTHDFLSKEDFEFYKNIIPHEI